MVAALGDKLNEALRKKGEDINTFVWKFPKDRENQNSQQSVKLLDC